MRYLRLLSLLLAAALMITLASCSDSREGEEPLDENTSQINLILISEGNEPFVTSEGYLIHLTHGELDLDEVIISGHEEDHDHHHIVSTKAKNGHHHDDEEGGTCIFEGPFEVNLLRHETDLGLQFTNPGNYSVLSLVIGEHHHDHTHHLKYSHKDEYISFLQKDHDDEHEDDDHHDDDHHDDDHHDHQASIELKGSAVKEGIEYLFKVHLHMEEEIDLTDLGLELRRGHHGRVGLIFEVDHWLDYVDISQAPVIDGIHIISDELTPETAHLIKDNIRRNIKTHLFD